MRTKLYRTKIVLGGVEYDIVPRSGKSGIQNQLVVATIIYTSPVLRVYKTVEDLRTAFKVDTAAELLLGQYEEESVADVSRIIGITKGCGVGEDYSGEEFTYVRGFGRSHPDFSLVKRSLTFVFHENEIELFL